MTNITILFLVIIFAAWLVLGCGVRKSYEDEHAVCYVTNVGVKELSCVPKKDSK